MTLVSWDNAVNRDRAELIFVNRNQAYGAYVIRRDYQRNLIFALLYTLAGIALIFSIPFISKLLAKPPVEIVPDKRIYDEHVLDAQPMEKPEVLQPSTLQKSVAQTIIFPIPVVSPDVVLQDPPVIDDLQDKNIGINDKPAEPGNDTHTITVVAPVEPDPNAVYSDAGVQEKPMFPGGEEALLSLLSNRIKYPGPAIEAGKEGIVYISFVVNKEGKVTDAKVVRGIGYGCDEEALRVVKSLPDWAPGKQNGRPVFVLFNVPIRFKLR